MSRLIRAGTALAVLGSLLVLPAAGSAGPSAEASGSCRVGNSRSYGTTYVLSISVKGVSCRRGRRVIRAFHACRPGQAGRCGRVRGYSCSESRFNKGPSSYDSRVSCRRGGKRVRHTYTQFT
jgi:hypothetical protein